jgi:predicted mannosyl-3-phosphoglycerate phosphatase (HAD superfamily)
MEMTMTTLAPTIPFPIPTPAPTPSAAPCVTVSLVIFSAIDHVWTEDGDGVAAEARDAVRALVSRGVPLVMVSQRSASELLRLQDRLGIRHPFVCGGGAALYVPAGYFPELAHIGTDRDGWNVVEFKAPYDAAPAVRLLASLYKLCTREEAMIVGLGATWSDRVLMQASDAAVVVGTGTADEARLREWMPSAYVTVARGAAGWSEAILGSVSE